MIDVCQETSEEDSDYIKVIRTRKKIKMDNNNSNEFKNDFRGNKRFGKTGLLIAPPGLAINKDNFYTVLEGYTQQIREINSLKKNFVLKSGIPKYEAFKIWANWIIRAKSNITSKQDHFFLPNNNLKLDIQTPQLLIEKGGAPHKVDYLLNNFYLKCQNLIENWKSSSNLQSLSNFFQDKIEKSYGVTESHKKNFNELTMILNVLAQEIEIKTINDGNKKVIKFLNVNQTVTTKLYNKLLGIFKANSLKKFNTNIHNMTLFHIFLIDLLNHYFLLDGLSYQWAIPPKAFEILQNKLGVKVELFASPLNSYFNSYFSLFEVDQYFGSYGNFFDINFEFFMKMNMNMRCNFYQVNPPFIEEIFIKSSNKIVDFLDQARDKNIDLNFIYIMPDWLDSQGYLKLLNSQYLIEEIILPRDQHYYYESNHEKYVRVRFETHILVVGTNLKKQWNSSIKSQIVKEFTNKAY